MATAKIDMTARFLNRPILVSEEFAQSIAAHAAKDLAIDDLRAETAQMWLDVSTGVRKPYRMKGSIAIIPINGRLYNKVDWAGYSYTGYNWIDSMLDHAEQDPDVHGVMLDVDSGGGEVDGAFETAARIASFKKPIRAAATHAYSAAYLLVSSAKHISVTQTGGVGSIGVVTMHVDLSKYYENIGVDVTLIHKGKHKVDGNPYEPLPKDVRKRIEARLEETYTLFVDTVATNRSMESQAVRNTEAQVYSAKEAIDLDLVDTVASLDEALAAFEADLNGTTRGTSMTVATDTKQQANADKSGNEASQAVNQQALDAAKAEGFKEGAAAESARIMGIIKCEEAKGRETMALTLAEQGLSVDQSKAVLASAPVAEQKTNAAGNFAAAMEGTPNPEVSAEGAQSGQEADVPAWKKAMSLYGAVSGQKFDLN